MLERRVSLVCAGVLMLCFISTAVLLVALPRSTRSEIEKRELATFPEFSLESYISGDYTADIAVFYDDTVPDRDGLKNLGNNFKLLFGIPQSEGSVQLIGNFEEFNPGGAESSAAPEPESSAPDPGNAVPISVASGLPAGAAGRFMDGSSPEPTPSADPFPDAVTEQADFIENIFLVKKDGHYWGFQAFGGGTGDDYVQALNDLHSQLDSSVTIWSMPCPLACQFYTPEEYKSYVVDQSECFNQIHARLDPGIKTINICSDLARHADEDIYCRTDHHWTNLGAYYGAEAFAKAAGVPFSDLSTYRPKTIEDCVGSIYSFSKLPELLNDPEDFTYYVPSTPYSAVYYDSAFEFQWDDDDLFAEWVPPEGAYQVNLGGDLYIIKVTTQVENGRKLMVIKDSYGNATIPFYTGSFEQVYVTDMRYFDRNILSFIRDMGITDVLFCTASFSVVGPNAELISGLMTQNAGETVVDPHPDPGPLAKTE